MYFQRGVQIGLWYRDRGRNKHPRAKRESINFLRLTDEQKLLLQASIDQIDCTILMQEENSSKESLSSTKVNPIYQKSKFMDNYEQNVEANRKVKSSSAGKLGKCNIIKLCH